MNYISVKEALVKSNTWGSGRKNRRGQGEESPMCTVVIETPFAAVIAKAFIFAFRVC